MVKELNEKITQLQVTWSNGDYVSNERRGDMAIGTIDAFKAVLDFIYGDDDD